MFNFFTSPGKKARTKAADWLKLARTVWNSRHDQLTSKETAEFTRSETVLAQLVRERAAPEKIELAIQSLESVLHRIGGAIYPRTSMAENVEFFLVATLIILGVHTYFIQPMTIPTNSMWPTYSGMTAENFPPNAATPGMFSRLVRLLAFGAVRKEVDAPASGEVSALFALDTNGQPLLIPAAVTGRSWLIFPSKLSEYTLYVNDEPVKIRLPEDFHDFDQVFMDTFFSEGRSLADQWQRAQSEGRIKRGLATSASGQAYDVYQVPLGRSVKAGEALIRFDLMKGDMVFVDRFSYHFSRPKAGNAFVFETGNIPELVREGIPDEYYVKRLAGLPGDTLEIIPPVLYRNGRPIKGAAAFDANASRQGQYRGYFNAPPDRGEYLLPGKSATVPAHSFMGLGDNSAISADGRYWGFVPEKDVIGRPLFIYYPFTRRWGWAK